MLMESDFPDGPLGKPLLAAYFPKRLRDSFAEHFEGHALRREIIATGAVNYVVNNAGMTFFGRAMAASGRGIGAVAAAYLEADSAAKAAPARDAVRGSAKAAAEKQAALLEIDAALEGTALAILKGAKGGKGSRS